MAMTKVVSGTFTVTGQSDETKLKGEFSLSLSFASTGSVTLQRKLPGQSTWNTVETYTASIETEGKQGGDLAGVAADYRLDCTDATGNITYWLG